MSRFWLEVFFTLVALGGIIMIVHGIALKPAKKGGPGDAGEEIVLDFSGRGDESAGLFELESSGESLARAEKKAFDPDKHLPEEIGGGKKG
ncbi:MAG: hypothetical protein WAW37_04345 [Syntrophobacteraceae bacterium]